jgi:MFS family permease
LAIDYSRDGAPLAEHASNAAPGYRWRLLAVLWFVVAVVVALPSVGSGVLNARMVTELQMDRGLYGAAFGLFVVMMGVPAPLVAAGVRRFGIKPIIMLGCMMTLVGSLLIATAVTEGWHFVLCFGLLVGGGVATAGVLPAQAAVTRWFIDKRALAVSIVLSAVDIGGILAAPSLEGVVSGHGWRSGWVVIATLAGLGLLAALLTLRNESGQDVGVPPLNERALHSRVHKTTHTWTVRESLRTRAFWCIAVFSVVVGLDWILIMAHGVIHLHDLGFSPASAASTIAVMVSASLAGNLLAGAAGDRVPPHRIGALAMLALLVGLFMGIDPSTEAGLMAFALPLGLGYGASQVCLMSLLANYFGARSFAALFGILLAVGTLAASLLAGGAGALFEKVHSYTPTFQFCAALTVIGMICIALASPPRGTVPSGS